MAVLKEHWQPKPSEIVQRYNFHSRVQKEGESIADYVAELRRLSEHCGFKESTLDDMLRDRLVCGVKDTRIQKKLLAESDLTFKKAYRTVQAVEAAERQSKELQDKDEAGQPVHAVQNKKSTDLTQGNCYRCGGFRHNSSECFFKEASCRLCGKTGHIARECRTKTDKPKKTGSQGKPTQKLARTHRINSFTVSNTLMRWGVVFCKWQQRINAFGPIFGFKKYQNDRHCHYIISTDCYTCTLTI